MAAKVVEEEAVLIALLLLVMGVHIAPWERRGHGWQPTGGRGTPMGCELQGAGELGSILTVHHHVVAQDAGCVEGSLPGALQAGPALQGGPHPTIHVEELSGVHPHREAVIGARGGSGQEEPFCPSALWHTVVTCWVWVHDLLLSKASRGQKDSTAGQALVGQTANPGSIPAPYIVPEPIMRVPLMQSQA